MEQVLSHLSKHHIRMFEHKIKRLPNGCWELNSQSTERYPKFNYFPGHQISYELYVGPRTDGLTIDHLCCNKRCVNPDHLEQVTSVENIKRYYASNK